MTALAFIFFIAAGCALLALPKRYAPVALLSGCCYVTIGQGIEISSVSLPIYRLLLAIGIFRIVVKSEDIVGFPNSIDRLMVVWGIWSMFASFFHSREFGGGGPIYTAGVVLNIVLVYFLIRAWCSNVAETQQLIAVTALVLLPVAIEMTLEKLSGRNMFSVFGGVSEHVIVRDGKLRAQGPFRHPILAGTVGAACFPLMAAIWKAKPAVSIIGMITCMAMVVASTSSGPLVSLAAGGLAIAMWPFRSSLGALRLLAVVLYVLLSFVMSRPPYYLITKLDLTGSSTGFHRAMLIEGTLNHFSEWWLIGTEKTRHWMPNQGAITPFKTDITNYYITFAVLGGLASIMLVILMLYKSFSWVGSMVDGQDITRKEAFSVWCMGSSLFSHVVTSFSVAYFDQSMFFFWCTVAMISSIKSRLDLSFAEGTSEGSLFTASQQDLPSYRLILGKS